MNALNDDDDWEYVKTHDMTEQELEENIKYFKNHPIFMKEVPEDIAQNVEFQALQNLAFEDSPENVARNCNERGNALYKKGPEILYYVREALKAYEEGIEIKCKDVEINTKLLSNRTLINLKLKNYGRVIADCKKIIEINEKFIKAYFRYASALFFVNRLEEGLKIIDQGLKIDNTCKDLLDLKLEITKKLQIEEEKKKSKTSQKEKEFKQLLDKLKEKNILLGQRTMELPEAYSQALYFDEKNLLHTPIIIYYPEFQQTDFIQDSNENDVLKSHLSEVFAGGLPWDSNGDYKNIEKLKCFIQLNSTTPYYKLNNYDSKDFDPHVATFQVIDMKTTVLKALQVPNHVIPMVLEVYIVSEQSKFFNVFVSFNKIRS